MASAERSQEGEPQLHGLQVCLFWPAQEVCVYLTACRKGPGPLLPQTRTPCSPGASCFPPMVLAGPGRAELSVLANVWGKGKVEGGQVIVFHKRAPSQGSLALPEKMRFFPEGLTRERLQL